MVACSNKLYLSAPQLSFVKTEIANISPGSENVRYIMRYKLTTDAPDNLYARVYYQDFRNKKIFHTTSVGGLGQSKLLNFKGPEDNQIINKHSFRIMLIL